MTTPTTSARRAAVRLGALSGVLTAVGIVTVFVLPFSRDDIERVVDPFGPAGPLVYVVVAGVLGALFVPGPLLSAASGALFGTWLGFVVSTTSSVLSAVLSSVVGGRAGNASAQELTGERSRALIDLARRRGFLVVVLQRWIPGIPDAPFSYLFGVLGIGLRSVVLGTALGSAPRAFAYTALGDAAITDSAPLAVAAVVVGVVISVIGVLAGVVVVRRHREPAVRPVPSPARTRQGVTWSTVRRGAEPVREGATVMSAPTRTRAVAAAADAVVQSAVPGVPGVVAGLTDRTETFYLGAAGVSDLGSGAEMTPDNVFAIFSTTKAVTGTTALQLVEEGALDLDAPASEYAPGLAEVQVLDGFDDAGNPVLRAPKRPITTKHLLLHTAGFGYDFFNEQYNRLATDHGQPSIVAASRASLKTPLLFDPGERWEYGSNIDWAGQVVEGITGKRLGEVMQERVFGPLGMSDTAFTLTDATRPRLAAMHQRGADGELSPNGFELPEPEVHMGGHGLHSTVPDYLRFMRMWLNDGAADSGEQVLRPETVEFAVTNKLDDLKVVALPGVIPSLSNDAEFFPGLSKSWSYTFMVNDEDAPTGRPAGAIAWAGLANLYYWIDRENDVAGFWATQIFPFADPASVGKYLEMETAVYDALRG